jgi:protein involved in polysaccharide export with SLBB domain
MEHPFIDKSTLADKSLEELQDTISGLMNKLTFAYRTGNGPLIHQLQMVIESYRGQYSKKMDEMFAKQKLNNQINIQSDKL